MNYASKDEYYLSKIREERAKVKQLGKDKQELIEHLLNICKDARKHGVIYISAEQTISKQTGKSIEELLKQ